VNKLYIAFCCFDVGEATNFVDPFTFLTTVGGDVPTVLQFDVPCFVEFEAKPVEDVHVYVFIGVYVKAFDREKVPTGRIKPT
jgi:hypothetical protein